MVKRIDPKLQPPARSLGSMRLLTRTCRVLLEGYMPCELIEFVLL